MLKLRGLGFQVQGERGRGAAYSRLSKAKQSSPAGHIWFLHGIFQNLFGQFWGTRIVRLPTSFLQVQAGPLSPLSQELHSLVQATYRKRELDTVRPGCQGLGEKILLPSPRPIAVNRHFVTKALCDSCWLGACKGLQDQCCWSLQLDHAGAACNLLLFPRALLDFTAARMGMMKGGSF